MTTRTASFNDQTRSGLRPFIVPVFIPHAGCPHRCAFCNQQAITDYQQKSLSARTVESIISRFLTYRQSYHATPEISFYGGNFLGLDPQTSRKLLNTAQRFVHRKQARSIRFSTRPDTVTPEIFRLIDGYSIQTVELGIQSMDNAVLRRSLRGHTAGDTRHAMRLLKQSGLRIGAQLMLGLPGQDEASAVHTAHQVAQLNPDVVRIYPTVVLQDSLLETWFLNGTYRPLTLDAAVNQAKRLLGIFQRYNIKVIRMGLQASEGLDSDKTLVAGPYHPAFGHLVHAKLFFDQAAAQLALEEAPISSVTLRFHPSSLPKVKGLKGDNLKKLTSRFHIESIELSPDDSMSTYELTAEARRS